MTKESMIEPLLLLDSRDSTNTKIVVDNMNMLKRSSMIFGFLFGIFMQFSTLGANWVIISILGRNSFLRVTQLQLFVCSLIWSFLSSIILINLLKLIRKIMSVVQTVEQYHSTSNNNNNRNYLPKNNKHLVARLDILMTFVEGPFVGCAFAGVCFAWAITDYILGLRVHMIYSFLVLIVAVGGCYCYYRIQSSSDVNESDECDKILMKDEEEQNSTTSTGRSNNDGTYDVTIL